MKTLKIWMAVLLLAPAMAGAQEVSDALFTDYISLTKALKANGIEPARVDWLTIEPICLGLKKEKDQVPYNRCRYEKINDRAYFYSDRDVCNDESLADYPDSMALGGQTTIAVLSSGTQGNQNSIITQNATPVSTEDVRTMRRASYNDCMRGLGWKNPRSWQMGRTKAADEAFE